METIIALSDRLIAAEKLLWEYVEQDTCVCDNREDWTCLACQANQHLEDNPRLDKPGHSD